MMGTGWRRPPKWPTSNTANSTRRSARRHSESWRRCCARQPTGRSASTRAAGGARQRRFELPPGAARPRSTTLCGRRGAGCTRLRAPRSPVLSHGSGTSQAGQSTNAAVIVDWTTYCDASMSVDREARACVVESDRRGGRAAGGLLRGSGADRVDAPGGHPPGLSLHPSPGLGLRPRLPAARERLRPGLGTGGPGSTRRRRSTRRTSDRRPRQASLSAARRLPVDDVCARGTHGRTLASGAFRSEASWSFLA